MYKAKLTINETNEVVEFESRSYLEMWRKFYTDFDTMLTRNDLLFVLGQVTEPEKSKSVNTFGDKAVFEFKKGEK